MVKAIMHGCNGHMGRVITDIIKNTEGIELVAGVDKYTKVPNDYPVFESIGACDVEADVIIDFSNAAAADELLDYCIDINKNGHLTDYNIDIAIRKIEDMVDSVIIQTPLVLHSDNFIKGDLKDDADFKNYIKEHMEVEPENLFAY